MKDERRWYVHDRYDCFGGFDTVNEAGEQAQFLAKDGLEGIHIIYATEAANNEYCRTGVL